MNCLENRFETSKASRPIEMKAYYKPGSHTENHLVGLQTDCFNTLRRKIVDYGLTPPKELTFQTSMHELVQKLSNHRSKQNQVSYDAKHQPSAIHIGTIVLNEGELRLRISEVEDTIQDLTVTDITRTDTFLGTPLKQDVPSFCTFLDQQNISWNRPDDEGLYLWENWVIFYIENDVIQHMTWINPDLLSDLELIELAFPSNK